MVFRKRPVGDAKLIVKVKSSTIWRSITSPSALAPARKFEPTVGVIASFSTTSSHTNLMSSVVTGTPSDHLRPLRSVNSYSVISSFTLHELQRFPVMGPVWCSGVFRKDSRACWHG